MHTKFTFDIQAFTENRPAVMVASHERSGTHFLMNSLASCYGYVSAPYLDLDPKIIGINCHHAAALRESLIGFANKRIANVVRSHHQPEFIEGIIGDVTKRFVIFYIYRHPADVMASFWQLVKHAEWSEGPRALHPLQFALSEPCGQLMRFQMRQHRNMLERWCSHVEGWSKLAQGNSRIVPVRYEDLDQQFDAKIQSFASVLERKPNQIVRPARDVNVIKSPGPKEPFDRDALDSVLRRNVGSTMERLGY